MSFWNDLKKPILGLSPMDGVTDAPFRYITAVTSRPSIIYTEFVNVDGIIKGGYSVLEPFLYSDAERPVLAQLYGTNPEYFYICAQLMCELGFDGIDINMGCPSKNIALRGAGAGLIRTPELAVEIVKMTKKGVSDWYEKGLIELPIKLMNRINKLKKDLSEKCDIKFSLERRLIPVSLKTRIGYDSDIAEEWIGKIVKSDPAAIALHGRTLKQMYEGLANWDAIKRAAKIVKNYNSNIIILGNGDVKSYEHAMQKIEENNLDGVLIGRATFGNPWMFDKNIIREELSYKDVKNKLIEHITYYDKIYGSSGFFRLRKHMCWYIKGYENSASLRAELMKTLDMQSAINVLENFN